jgi:multidrug resistance efflux pump
MKLIHTMPRRKVRVGDRVSSSQGVVTIPEVDRMLVEGSVGEAEVRRIRAGQRASVRLEAFPDLRLGGRVERVGTLELIKEARSRGIR